MTVADGQNFHELVCRGDVSALRVFCDHRFLRNEKIAPTWGDMKEALLRENRDMVRFLAVWGAPVTDESLAGLCREMPKKYPVYIDLLRRAQVPLSPVALDAARRTLEQQAQAAVEEVRYGPVSISLARMPEEWIRLLKSFHAAGAPEAVVAGSAMRDVVDGKDIGPAPVDIYLKSPESRGAQQVMIETAFAAAGIPLKHRKEPSGAPQVEIHLWSHPQIGAGSWHLERSGVYGYRINFVESGRLADTEDFPGVLLRSLPDNCQIVSNGSSIITSTPFLEKMTGRFSGQLITDAGVCIGQWTPKDRNGDSIGRTFNIYAAPEDLKDGERKTLSLTFNQAVHYLSRLKNWHGHDGVGYNNERELLQALQKGGYKGEWFIPPIEILIGKDANNVKVQADNLHAATDSGLLAFDVSAPSGVYWSCTESALPNSVWVGSTQCGSIGKDFLIPFRKDVVDFPCRLVRAVEVPPPEKMTGGGRNTGPR